MSIQSNVSQVTIFFKYPFSSLFCFIIFMYDAGRPRYGRSSLPCSSSLAIYSLKMFRSVCVLWCDMTFAAGEREYILRLFVVNMEHRLSYLAVAWLCTRA